MTHRTHLFLAFVASTFALLTASEPVLARGAAANIMNSPGYQRRLQESRQQLGTPKAQAPASRKTQAKHRRHRHVH